MRLRGFVLLISLLLVGHAAGQDQVIRTQTTVVLTPALVKDAKGNLIYGLHAEDFAIEDDGVAQTVQLDEDLDTQPACLVVAVQRGGAVYPELSRMQGLGAMLDPAIDQGKTDIAIVEFDSKVGLAQDFTHDGDVIRRELRRLTPGDGGAAVLDAVNFSVKLLNNAPSDRMKVLLLISETRDHGSRLTLPDVIAAVANSNIVTYTLAFSPALSQVLDNVRGNNRDAANTMNLLAPLIMAGNAMRKNIPKGISLLTGGEYELFKSASGFDMRMNEFDNHLYNRYLLSFQPIDPHPGLHQVRVRLKEQPKAIVLARTNYWIAPKLH